MTESICRNILAIGAMVGLCWPAPLAAHDDEPVPAQLATVSRIPSPLRYPEIRVARDPFDRPMAATVADVAQLVPAQIPDFGLPPNSNAPSFSNFAAVDKRPTLRAIVIGETRKVLLEVNGHIVLAGIGSRAGSATITSIDDRRVRLSDSTELRLSGAKP